MKTCLLRIRESQEFVWESDIAPASERKPLEIAGYGGALAMAIELTKQTGKTVDIYVLDTSIEQMGSAVKSTSGW